MSIVVIIEYFILERKREMSIGGKKKKEVMVHWFFQFHFPPLKTRPIESQIKGKRKPNIMEFSTSSNPNPYQEESLQDKQTPKPK